MTDVLASVCMVDPDGDLWYFRNGTNSWHPPELRTAHFRPSDWLPHSDGALARRSAMIQAMTYGSDDTLDIALEVGHIGNHLLWTTCIY